MSAHNVHRSCGLREQLFLDTTALVAHMRMVVRPV